MRSVHEAREMGSSLGDMLYERKIERAYQRLYPVLAERTSFRLLDIIGSIVGQCPQQEVNLFIDRIAADRTMGGWVVIASALTERLPVDLPDTLTRTHDLIISADTWYATDIFGERVPGPALLSFFDETISLIEEWRADENPWVRRILGVAVHFWAKRTRGTKDSLPQAQRLLDLLDALYEEKSIDALKGIGWALKTLGRYYPDLLTDWLETQIMQRKRKARALMNRKAITYLPQAHKERICEARHQA